MGVGKTPITATLNGVSGATTVTVSAATVTSITISVPAGSIARGTTLQLTATCNFSDGTTQDCTDEVSWASSNSGVATVSDTSPTNGLLTGVGTGNSAITGSFGGMQGSATVTVTDANLISITVLPDPSIAKGTTVQLTATGNFSDGTTQDLTTQVSWTSGDNTIAQVSNVAGSQGLVTGLAVANTPITATLNGVSGSTTVTVTAATVASITITVPVASIAKGTTAQLTATCNFSDGTTQDCTTQVSWTSGDNRIAEVSNASGTQGLVTGLGIGSTSITGTFNGISGSATVTVTVATLSSIQVTPPNPSLAKGTTVPLTATGTFSDGTTQDLTTQVSWTSGDNTIAEVSNVAGSQGLVTGVAVASTPITATLNGVSGATTVTVTAATVASITVTVPVASIAKGTTAQLTATCNFSDGTTQDCTSQVSWTSGDNTIAEVSNASGTQGLVTGQGVGNTSITATFNGVSGSANVTVTPATLSSIQVTSPDSSIAKGTTVQLTATSTFSDGTTQDLTTQVSWTSGDNTIASVSNVAGSQGLSPASMSRVRP
jgi:uncharacterized protein YjdB